MDSSLGAALLVCISSSLFTCMAQSETLSLSSGSVAAGGSISLNLSAASSGTLPSALQWTVNYPASAIAGMSVAASSTATAAGKSVTCSGNVCVLYGMNSQSIPNGTEAVLTFRLASSASGNLAIQLGSGFAASPIGDALPVSTTGGVIAVTSTTTNKPPVVTLTTPANGAVYTAPATIVMTATASDPDGTVAGVDFYQGANKLGTKSAPPYTWTAYNVPVGSYSGASAFTARATDNQGATTTSNAVAVTVSSAVNKPPVVTLTTPPMAPSILLPPPS